MGYRLWAMGFMKCFEALLRPIAFAEWNEARRNI